jgi:hypothetical protein
VTLKVQGNILYRFYYENSVVYLGRTKQPLQDRIRGHLFKKPMHRAIDINLVTKIEYATFPTEADMNIYEIYLINKLKPMLNVDDKTSDEVTVTLPEVEFKTFECHLWEKWKQEINAKNDEFSLKKDRYYSIHQEFRIVRDKYKMGQITKDECYEQLDKLKEDENSLRKYLYG